jgi:hypothetical protein
MAAQKSHSSPLLCRIADVSILTGCEYRSYVSWLMSHAIHANQWLALGLSLFEFGETSARLSTRT